MVTISNDKNTTVYEVEMVFYKYNSGRGDNGNYICTEKFSNLESAKNFYNETKIEFSCGTLPENFADQYVGFGYLVSIKGIYKITKEKLC